MPESSVPGTDDDSYLQLLEEYRQHPLNLNTVTADELKSLQLLTDLQVDYFIAYRKATGLLTGVYELQAVPAMDLQTIRNILPYITVQSNDPLFPSGKKPYRETVHSFILRAGLPVQQQQGYRHDSASSFAGNRLKLLFRYRFRYNKKLQAGITGEKDAGEAFRGKGFDFYSVHLCLQGKKLLRKLVLGDFIINQGQGLVQWQAGSYGGGITSVKKQGELLRPYTSAGEFNFHRGAALLLARKKIQSLVYVSARLLSARTDSSAGRLVIRSVDERGLNRTAQELAMRNTCAKWSAGSSLLYTLKHGHAGVHMAGSYYSLPWENNGDAYMYFKPAGRRQVNASVDYSYTWKNLHLFGELALDEKRHRAWVSGLLLSADPALDISVLLRNGQPGYHAAGAQAFTAGSGAGNERGVYMALLFRARRNWVWEAAADLYRVPWISYRTDAPATGSRYYISSVYTAGKHCIISARYILSSRDQNTDAGEMSGLSPVQVGHWRLEVLRQGLGAWSLKYRAAWCRARVNRQPENGFLQFIDIKYAPVNRNWSVQARWQYFETEGYDSRIYAYEGDVLYKYGIPEFHGRGIRYYLLATYEPARNWRLDFRWAETVYNEPVTTGNGPELLTGRKRSEMTFQVRFLY